MSSGASTSDPTAKAIALAKKTFETAKTKFAAMSKPARVMLFSTLAAAIVLVAYFGYHSTNTPWSTLFTNLDREDAAAVVAKLKEMKVPYRIEGDGGSISVPEANARELRLELAGAGLPRGGGVGFESFDKMRLGATEFEQRVLYRRSLEGELSRTIDTIAAVQSARVHLVLPERSVFVGRQEPATASVVLKLRAGRALGAAEVAGIVHLVSSSVAQLTPERVAVVTTDGTMLHKPRKVGEGGDASGDSEEAANTARNLESSLEERARSMLEKVIGPGKVDVRVSAELDRSRVERVEDRYDPKTTALRSEQSTVEKSGVDNSATGVPGAESNLPGGNRGADGGTDVTTREAHTRNFEVDHVTEKRLLVSGTLRRLTVAVVVDGGHGTAGRSKEDMDRLTALVRSAVGADERRGDVVTVEAVPFLDAEAATPAPAPSILASVPDKYKRYVPIAAGALLLLTFASVGLTVARARKKSKVKALAAATEATALLVAAKPEPTEIIEIIEKLQPEELRTRAHDRAAEDPATAALVLRFWLGEGDDRREAPALGAVSPAARLG